MPTTIEQIDAWRSVRREDQHLEFKVAANQFDSRKLYRYCVALANEGGGKLLLGIEDRPPRKVVGTLAFADTIEAAAKIVQVLGFRVEVEEVQHPDGRVLVFHVPPRPFGTAYQHDGAYLMRAGEELVPMSEDRLRTIFSEGHPDWLSQEALSNCNAATVIELLDTTTYFDLMQIPYPTDQSGVLYKLASEKLIEKRGTGWAITNLGAILFAKQLSAFDGLSRKAARVIVYKGKSKLSTSVDRVLSKGYAVGFQELVALINSLTPTNEVIGQSLRQEIKMFPEIAIRELVANSLIHQDFLESGTSASIELYSDRLEISNPGKPFIPPDRFIDEYQSRNERLADVMRRLRICEEKGSGIDKVIHASEVYQLPAPDFRESDRRTTAVLFGHLELDQMDRNDRIRACYQHCCLRYVMNERMTNQSLRNRFRLAENKTATISQMISMAVDAGRVKIADPSVTSTRYRSYIPYWA